MTSIFRIVFAAFLLFFFVGVPAHEDETLFNVVHLQAQSEREIPNDEMLVVLAVEQEGSDASRIAADINKDMQWALEIIKPRDAVESKTGNYRTYPVYNKQTITGWRASQQVEIKSQDMAVLTGLVGQLQARLQVKQMNFRPTDAARKQHENELIEDAMVAFRERVEIIKKHMKNADYRIVNLNINTGSSGPPILYERAAMKTMDLDTAVSPAVEAGSSKITVTVNGSVQFF